MELTHLDSDASIYIGEIICGLWTKTPFEGIDSSVFCFLSMKLLNRISGILIRCVDSVRGYGVKHSI